MSGNDVINRLINSITYALKATKGCNGNKIIIEDILKFTSRIMINDCNITHKELDTYNLYLNFSYQFSVPNYNWTSKIFNPTNNDLSDKNNWIDYKKDKR